MGQGSTCFIFYNDPFRRTLTPSSNTTTTTTTTTATTTTTTTTPIPDNSTSTVKRNEKTKQNKKNKKEQSQFPISDEELIEIQEAFRLCDTKNIGTLNHKQLKEALLLLGFKTTLDEVKSLTPAPISLETFCDIIATKKKDRQIEQDRFQNAFDLFDIDKKGFIDFSDLKRVAKLIGEEQVTDEQLHHMIRYADRKDNQCVFREDFNFIFNTTNIDE